MRHPPRGHSLGQRPGRRQLTSPGTTSAAPEPSVTTSSETAASKLSDANCKTRDPGPTPNRSAWLQTRPARPRCETTTPFGTPVDPDV